MTQLLVSVSNIDEAKIALASGVDIIDLKCPARGALGALDIDVVVEIVKYINMQQGCKLITTTLGDLPMQPELLVKHVNLVADTKVDVIKIGFFNTADKPLETYRACLETLQTITAQGTKLVAVLFAEYAYPTEIINMICSAGFYGVMIDTAHKNSTTFLDHYSYQEISDLVAAVKKQHLQFGLAGSLQLQHIQAVKKLNPDYIGFRGGLCFDSERKNSLDADKVNAARKMI